MLHNKYNEPCSVLLINFQMVFHHASGEEYIYGHGEWMLWKRRKGKVTFSRAVEICGGALKAITKYESFGVVLVVHL